MRISKTALAFLITISFLPFFIAMAQNPEVKPTMKDVSYGPHEHQVLNLWKAESDAPTPVVFDLTGGGWWKGGTAPATVNKYPFLGRGVSIVSPRYRVGKDALLPIPIMDFARAVQFVRYKAEEWGLDKDRVAFLGMSAGACSALWLGLHDDLADPENEDPVLRQSTKPICVLARSGQTFIDARMVEKYVGRPAMTRMIWQQVGAKSPDDALERYEEFEHLYTEYSPYNHLDKDDPPVLLYYKTDMNNEGTHSARYGAKLLERAEEVGATVYLASPDHPVDKSFPYDGQWSFVYDQLLETKLESDVDETENRAE